MKLENSNKTKIAINIILFAFGLVFIALAVCLHLQDSIVKNSWIEYDAIITRIDHNDEETHIKYEYNGKEYKEVVSYYSSFLDEGDILKISIDPNDYSNVYVHNINFIFIMFYIFGTGFLIAGIIVVFNYFKNKKNKQLCVENGIRKVLDVFEFKKTNFHYNRHPYYIIIVKYNDIEYKSEMFLLPKEVSFINEAVVDSYFCEDGKYYIDITTYREKIDIFNE